MIIGSYFVGSFPSGYLVYKIKTGRDIRKEGLRKNTGATNVFLVGGVIPGIITLILDIAKGTIPVLIINYLTGGNEIIMIFGGVMAIVGHVFPIFIGFKGGTGLATAMGALLALMPGIIISYTAIFLIVTPIIKRPSLLGLILMTIIPLFSYMLGYSKLIVGIATVMGLMYFIISLNHLKSMIKGNEYKEVLSLLGKFKH